MFVFKPFSQTSVISEVDAVISGVQNCQVAGLVLAFWQPRHHFGTSLGKHRSSRQDCFVESDFQRFAVDFRPLPSLRVPLWLFGLPGLFGFHFPNISARWLAGFWMLVFRSCS